MRVHLEADVEPARVRVLLYGNWHVKHSIALANALARDIEVAAVFPFSETSVSTNDGAVHWATLRQLIDPRVHLLLLRHMQGMDPLGLLTVWRVWRFCRQFRPDIVHLTETYDFRSLLIAALIRRPKYVLTVHDPRPHASERISLRSFKHAVRDTLRRLADALVVYGDRLRVPLAEATRISLSRIHAIPLGTYEYFTLFRPREVLGSRDGKRVLFFGRWENYKGIDVLVRAAPLILKRVPSTKVVLAGAGAITSDDLRPLMTDERHFIIHNYPVPDEEVAQLFRAADVVVFPYRAATQSGPLYIAASFGKPVVVTDTGAMPELVRTGGLGLVVPPEDSRALADAICTILEDPSAAKAMSDAATRMMSGPESISAVASQFTRLYRTLTDRPQSAQ